MVNTISIVGCVADPEFHRCCSLGESLAAGAPSVDVQTSSMYETQWEEYFTTKQRELGGGAFKHKSRYVVLLDGGRRFLGGAEELKGYAMTAFQLECSEDEQQDWPAFARDAYKAAVTEQGNKLCFMEVVLGAERRREFVVFELFVGLCPVTCENFRALCTGEKGASQVTGQRLCYKGSPFHRVVEDGWVQGGDIVSGAGDKGESIYGPMFADEAFSVQFDAPGVLAMANDGPHTNASQFFVTLAPLPWMNHQAVGFGRVICGMGAFRSMSELDTLNQRPKTVCEVAMCGELTPDELVARPRA